MATSDKTYKTYTVKRRAGWRRRTLVKAGEKKRNFLQWSSAKKWIDKKMGLMADEPAVAETEAARQEAKADRRRNTGPFDIVAIRAVDDGLLVVVAPRSNLRDGDRVRLEATGNTDVNGEYELTQHSDTEFLIETDTTLDEPIEKRGRVTRLEEE